MRLYLEKKGWWSSDEVTTHSVHFYLKYQTYMTHCRTPQDEEFRKETAKLTIKCLKIAEAKKKPSIREMFLDVYDEMPVNLKEQEQELKDFLKTYGANYKLEGFDG